MTFVDLASASQREGARSIFVVLIELPLVDVACIVMLDLARPVKQVLLEFSFISKSLLVPLFL